MTYVFTNQNSIIKELQMPIFYVITKNGAYYCGTRGRFTNDLGLAKIYPSLKRAKNAKSFYKGMDWDDMEGAKIVEIQVQLGKELNV